MAIKVERQNKTIFFRNFSGEKNVAMDSFFCGCTSERQGGREVQRKWVRAGEQQGTEGGL